MWPSRLRPPALRWSTTRHFAGRAPPTPRGPRNSLRRKGFPQPIPEAKRQAAAQDASNKPAPDPTPETSEPSRAEALSTALHDTKPEDNSLLSPVHIPEDPKGVLYERHPATKLLANSGLVVQRQMEMMNVMLGFEQANRYVIYDGSGNHVGYMAEQEKGMGNMMARQWFRTHRSFVTHVFDKHENEVLRFHRPFSYINSRIRIYDPLELADASYSSSTAVQEIPAGPLVHATAGASARISPLDLSEMRIIGETQQQWAPLRRKYNLFLHHASPEEATDLGTRPLQLSDSDLSKSQQLQVSKASGSKSTGEYGQFAYVDEPFLSWDFSLRSADSRLIGSVNRNFAGFAREIFTDTGVYALRMDSAGLAEEKSQRSQADQVNDSASLYDDKPTGMTLDQRAVMLATAVTVDFDYFSRHSSAGGMGFMPLWFPGGGGEAAGGGTAAGEVGAAGEGAAGGVTRGAGGVTGGVGDGAAAGATGAGTMAGYEAMQRGVPGDPAQPPAGAKEDVWGGNDNDPWNQGGGGDDPWGRGGGGGSAAGGSSPGAGQGQGGGDGGGGDWDFDDFF